MRASSTNSRTGKPVLALNHRASSRQADLKVTLHSLRHTHASTLIAAGLDVLTISRRLGHGTPAITLGVYRHLFKPDDRAAAIIEKALAATEEG
jgi:integrase